MQIRKIIWLEHIVEKIETRHHLSPDEVEEVFANYPKYRKAEAGDVQGEDLYYAYGRADNGRYIFIVFIYKRTHDALIVSARDMDQKERKRYVKK